MDRKFLKEVTKGYITNHDVYNEYTPKEVDLIEQKIYDDLCDLTTEVRLLDEDRYNKVYFSNRLQQYQILENYLNIRYQKEEQTEQLEEGWVQTGLAAGGLVGAAYGLFKAGLIAKGFWGLIALFSNPFVFGSLTLLTLMAYQLNQKHINKMFFGLLANYGKLAEKFGNMIKKAGKIHQFRYAIAQKNFDICYRKCGIENLDNLNFSDFATRYIGDKGQSMTTNKQALCLAECFVTTHIEQINIALTMYMECLKSTKEFDNISNFKGTDFFQFVKSQSFVKYGFNANSVCNEYLKQASELLNTFDDVLDYVYKNEASKRQVMNKLMAEMNKTINEANKHKNVIQKTFPHNNFNKNRY